MREYPYIHDWNIGEIVICIHRKLHCMYVMYNGRHASSMHLVAAQRCGMLLGDLFSAIQRKKEKTNSPKSNTNIWRFRFFPGKVELNHLTEFLMEFPAAFCVRAPYMYILYVCMYNESNTLDRRITNFIALSLRAHAS